MNHKGHKIVSRLQEIEEKVCPPSNGRNGAVLLLTDGAVGNEDEILSLVRGHSDLRVFPVGIGAGCNEAFIKGLARAGKGASAFIHPGERMASKILHLFGKMSEQINITSLSSFQNRVLTEPPDISTIIVSHEYDFLAATTRKIYSMEAGQIRFNGDANTLHDHHHRHLQARHPHSYDLMDWDKGIDGDTSCGSGKPLDRNKPIL